MNLELRVDERKTNHCHIQEEGECCIKLDNRNFQLSNVLSCTILTNLNIFTSVRSQNQLIIKRERDPTDIKEGETLEIFVLLLDFVLEFIGAKKTKMD